MIDPASAAMIDLVEYRTDTVALAHDEAAELSEMTKGTDATGRPRVIEQLSPAAGGGWRIRPGPYVGRFRLRGGRVVNIAGRFPFQDLAKLLALGERTILLHEATAAAGGGAGLMDLIALAYAREAELIAGQGLIKAYERRRFTRPPYPGTPAPALHFKAHAGRPDRIATTAARLTSDVPLNRLVATALRRLCTVTTVEDTIGLRLRALLPVFQALDDLTGPPPPAADAPPRYREIHRLAGLVLRDGTALPTGAGAAGVSVLFTMTTIWEAYVKRWLERRHPGDTVHTQFPIELIDSGPPRSPARADFVVERAGAKVAVYDAKYREFKGAPASDEIFQLYTYARRLGVTRAGLIYPGADPKRTEVTVDGVTIETHAVPVE